MTRFKILLITCMAVLGVTAVSAAAAQASTTWQVGGSTLPEGKTANIKSSGGPFTLEVPELPATIRCSTESNTGTIFNKKNAKGELQGFDTATVNFTGCVVVGFEKVCTVTEPITTNTNTELITVGGVIYDKFTSTTGVFTTITIKGASCPLLGSYNVTGNTAGKVGPAAVKATLEFSKSISSASGTQLLFEGLKAYLTGTSIQELTGEYAGKTLGAK